MIWCFRMCGQRKEIVGVKEWGGWGVAVRLTLDLRVPLYQFTWTNVLKC